jgi:hypothetical protein
MSPNGLSFLLAKVDHTREQDSKPCVREMLKNDVRPLFWQMWRCADERLAWPVHAVFASND